jgi:hypothetical protein
MTNDERKEIIRQLLKEGKRLSEIQNFLIKEKQDSITYLELRLLVADMQDVRLPDESSSKFAAPVTATPVASPAGTAKAAPPSPPGGRKTTVEIDSVVRAGAALSGKVSFSSGAKAEWILDGYGRVGLDPLPGFAKPTPQDLQEFQAELRRIIQEAQGGF